ncbi:DUF4129 domain-containing protein [Cellulomonas soli]|uniref:DUF4129 domain-containing protein n=1 Tax=Cellulomonas soli TaxID=931535 RepID=UPI003F8662B8
MTLLGAGVPVDPDAPTARRWASDELARAEYHQGKSLLQRLLDWIGQQFDGLPSVGLPPWQAALVVVGVLVVVVLVALWITGPVRLSRARRAGVELLGHDDERTAAELRAAADAAAARGEHGLAVLERFRAVVRSLEERALLEARPGRTAHEVADEAGRRLPEAAADLVRAGHLFDDVAYGGLEVGAEQDEWLRALDSRVRDLRPARPGAQAVGAEAVR